MARTPLYTVQNPSKEPRQVKYAGRWEPIDVGRDKALPLTLDEAVALAGEGFNVSGPDGKPIRAKAKAKG